MGTRKGGYTMTNIYYTAREGRRNANDNTTPHGEDAL